MDSFYEYLLKSHIMFNEEEDRQKFEETYESILKYNRRGRRKCNFGHGLHPIYVNVNMKNGATANHWIDSLQAAFPGLQVRFILTLVLIHQAYQQSWPVFSHVVPVRPSPLVKISQNKTKLK